MQGPGQSHRPSPHPSTVLMFGTEKPARHHKGNEQSQPNPLWQLPSPCVPGTRGLPAFRCRFHTSGSPYGGPARASPAAAWQTHTGHSTRPGFTAHLEQTCCIPHKVQGAANLLPAQTTVCPTNTRHSKWCLSRAQVTGNCCHPHGAPTAAKYHPKPPQPCIRSCSHHPDLSRYQV